MTENTASPHLAKKTAMLPRNHWNLTHTLCAVLVLAIFAAGSLVGFWLHNAIGWLAVVVLSLALVLYTSGLGVWLARRLFRAPTRPSPLSKFHAGLGDLTPNNRRRRR